MDDRPVLRTPGPLAPFILADGSTPARWQTRVDVGWDDERVHFRFECEDEDAWGTHRERDAPLWEEEVVEVFLAPGEADPTDYFEFEVSPGGVLFDARIANPTSRRADLRADIAWNCPGIAWRVGRGRARQDWWAELSLPWRSLVAEGPLPAAWRLNLYRIERPRGGEPEFSCWSPTFTDPPDFHQPAHFGLLMRGA